MTFTVDFLIICQQEALQQVSLYHPRPRPDALKAQLMRSWRQFAVSCKSTLAAARHSLSLRVLCQLFVKEAVEEVTPLTALLWQILPQIPDTRDHNTQSPVLLPSNYMLAKFADETAAKKTLRDSFEPETCRNSRQQWHQFGHMAPITVVASTLSLQQLDQSPIQFCCILTVDDPIQQHMCTRPVITWKSE